MCEHCSQPGQGPLYNLDLLANKLGVLTPTTYPDEDNRLEIMPSDTNILRMCTNTFTERYEFIRNLGQGSEGETSLWQWRDTPEATVAVKLIRKAHPTTKDEADMLKHLRQFNQERIIKLMATYSRMPNQNNKLLLLEPCRYDLHTYKEQQDVQGLAVPESFIWRVFQQVTEALRFLHKGPEGHTGRWISIIHHDVKAVNVLLKPHLQFRNIVYMDSVKLADFGFAAEYNPSMRHCVCGTYEYMPPECQSNNLTCATPAKDIWALGGVIHFLVHGFGPVSQDPSLRRLPSKLIPKVVCRVDAKPPNGAQSWKRVYSTELNDFMSICLTTDRKKRVAADSLLWAMEARERLRDDSNSATPGLMECRGRRARQ